ncbi:hypothetical protein MOO44_01740 [Nicoliella spurrieriana]|uniref:Gram-positive cocci surface proteins LPxTG domain-containing protein n=1 Tax=Nicoliella spurrieriana TaxID=2925830 RepID=A0A976X5R2_9LACO|nr:hypothetical protein [Nicoliella spurrieriana]UQS86924.1 hypothetical protein MOO44_01740 [Nicoliella spurrieriana]
MKYNKFEYKKTNEKKVLHKVKKQWVVLGTAAFTFLAVETAPQVMDNHSFGFTEAVANADTNTNQGGSTSSTDTSAKADATSGASDKASSGAADSSSATSTTSSGASTSASASNSSTTSGSTTSANVGVTYSGKSSEAVNSNGSAAASADIGSKPSSGSNSGANTSADNTTNTLDINANAAVNTDNELELDLRMGDDGSSSGSDIAQIPATSNESVVDSAPVLASKVGLGISSNAIDNKNGTTTYSNRVIFNESSKPSNASIAYHTTTLIQNNSYSDDGNTIYYGYANAYVNNSNGNSPFSDSVVSDISSLSFYYTNNSGSTSTTTISDSDISSYVHFIKSTDSSTWQFNYSDTANTTSATSGVSILLFSLPSSYYSINFKPGDNFGLSYNLSDTANNSSYSDISYYNVDSSGASEKQGSVAYAHFSPVATLFTYPVQVSYLDQNGSAIASAGSSTQYLTGDNIYPGNSFAVPVKSISGYDFDHAFINNTGTSYASSDASGNPVILGKFITGGVSTDNGNKIVAQQVNLYYKPITSVSDTFNFFDNTNQSSLASSFPISGIPGSSININSVTSFAASQYANYVWDSSANESLSSLSIGSSAASYTVYLTHKTSTFAPGDTNNLPNGNALSSASLAQTYTRTVSFVDGNGKPVSTASSASVTFTRSAIYDYVTSSVSYTNWSANSSNVSEYTFPAVADSISGYTLTSSVAASTVSADNGSDVSASSAFSANAVYSVNAIAYTFSYYDNTDSKALDIKTTTRSGSAGSSVGDLESLVPDNYEWDASANTSLNNLTFNSKASTLYKIYLTHRIVSYAANALPSGIAADQLTETHTRTFNLVDSNNHALSSAVVQAVDYNRSAGVDAFTNSVVAYGSWVPTSGEFAAYGAPASLVSGSAVYLVQSTATNPASYASSYAPVAGGSSTSTAYTIYYSLSSSSTGSTTPSVTPSNPSSTTPTVPTIIHVDNSVTSVTSSSASNYTLSSGSLVSSASTTSSSAKSSFTSSSATSSASSVASSTSSAVSSTASSTTSSEVTSVVTSKSTSVDVEPAGKSKHTQSSKKTTTAKKSKKGGETDIKGARDQFNRKTNKGKQTASANKKRRAKYKEQRKQKTTTQITSYKNKQHRRFGKHGVNVKHGAGAKHSYALKHGGTAANATYKYRDSAKFNQKAQLPQTSENHTTSEFSLVGLAMVAVSGIFAGMYKRQK